MAETLPGSHCLGVEVRPADTLVKHHPWIDSFPSPQLRHNLLRSFQHPDLCDEDELCHDTFDYKDAEKELIPII